MPLQVVSAVCFLILPTIMITILIVIVITIILQTIIVIIMITTMIKTTRLICLILLMSYLYQCGLFQKSVFGQSKSWMSVTTQSFYLTHV